VLCVLLLCLVSCCFPVAFPLENNTPLLPHLRCTALGHARCKRALSTRAPPCNHAPQVCGVRDVFSISKFCLLANSSSWLARARLVAAKKQQEKQEKQMERLHLLHSSKGRSPLGDLVEMERRRILSIGELQFAGQSFNFSSTFH